MEALAYSLLLAHLATLSPDAQQQQNICLSPYSLQSAFALVQEGAKKDTYREIEKTLHLQDFTILPDAIPSDGYGITFEQANSIWINANNCPKIKESFLKSNRMKYQAQMATLPFDEAAKQQINNWCSQKTHGRIPSVIDQMDNSEVMKLINAIYFKGSWFHEFNPRFTKKQEFYCEGTSDETLMVDMMHNTIRYLYGEDDKCQMVQMPFSQNYDEQDEYAMQVILPREGTTLFALEQELLKGYELPSLEAVKVRLDLPKFELNYSADLIPTLQEMGMELPFTNQANFQRISKKELRISSVTQKTYFKVDESGAEAAAVTAIGMMLTSAAPRMEKVYEMTVDHPFLVKLINVTKQTTLFVANIMNPNQK